MRGNVLQSVASRKIKIIGGKWKGRVIPVISNSGVRPTTSRIREMLFSWLNPVILGAACLDCCAGSGALGLESLSRGAGKVTFLDKSLFCVMALKRLSRSFLVCNSSEIIHTDCCIWLRKSISTYNIVFIDPPFQDYRIIPEVIFLLEQYNHFEKESWIYIENARGNDICITNIIPNCWFLYKKKVTRNIVCHLFQRK